MNCSPVRKAYIKEDWIIYIQYLAEKALRLSMIIIWIQATCWRFSRDRDKNALWYKTEPSRDITLQNTVSVLFLYFLRYFLTNSSLSINAADFWFMLGRRCGIKTDFSPKLVEFPVDLQLFDILIEGGLRHLINCLVDKQMAGWISDSKFWLVVYSLSSSVVQFCTLLPSKDLL